MDGTLLIDKPQGMTSHDVVAIARRALRTRAIGHAGTLDPMATGLLILLVGYAARLSEYVLHLDKAYDATIRFGEQTNTDDAEGEVIATRSVPPLSLEVLNAAARQFTGEIMQVPPQFSAISKGGVRAYARARAGEQVELAARPVRIDAITFTSVNDSHASMSMSCGSGTYVRSVARDLGLALGCGAHLAALRRTRIGPMLASAAIAPAAIAAEHMQPADVAVMHLPAFTLDARGLVDFLHGREAAGDGEFVAQPARVYDANRRFVGIGVPCALNRVKPEKVFVAS